MPRGDGTGPMGGGSRTGRGLGACTGVNATRGAGLGMGLGRRGRSGGFGRGFAVDQTANKTQEDLLKEQRNNLQNQLEVIEKQIESL